MDYLKLSKVISFALRHHPEQYGLLLDKNGWGDIKFLIHGIKKQHDEFELLTKHDLVNAIKASDKRRHEISGSKIRALYGHTISATIKKSEAIPPVFLYHGTSRKNLKNIKEKGLLKMGRQYVHLSEVIGQATQVALRKTTNPVILKIKAIDAAKDGVAFYKEDNVWLCNNVPAIFIEQMES